MVKGIILDLDGTVYVDARPIPGAKEAIEELLEMKYRLIFLTNNSTYSRNKVVRKLASFGINADIEQIVTSSYAAAEYVLKVRGKSKVLPVGEDGLMEELSVAGHELTDDYREAEVVVVGLDRKVTYEKFLKAHMAILRGALFVATNKDSTLPMEMGEVPGAGALVAFLEASTRKSAISIGKPERFIIEIALAKMGIRAEDALIVGDRVDTDVAAARKSGAKAVLLLTGARKDMIPNDVHKLFSLADLPKALAEGLIT